MNLGKENEYTEFKKTTGELRKGVISICAMLNKGGKGTLYFGIKDDGTIIGQTIGNDTLRDIANEIKYKIAPKISPTIIKEVSDGKEYIKVIFNGNDRPYNAYTRYYIRVSDEDQEMSRSEIAEMVLENNHMDIITLIKSPRQDLTFNQLRELYFARNIPLNNKKFEHNIGLYAPDEKYNLMAYLLADNNDLSIKVVKFSGKDKLDMEKRNEYGNKCLLLSIEQVLNYIESLNETKVEITTHKRLEEKLFDMACFREAWLNAVQHSRWNDTVPPVVYIYNNRIEIVSYGGLPRGLSLEQFYMGESKPVNDRLQKILGQLHYIEQTGHGVPLIISRYGKRAFNIDKNFITVTIPFKWKIGYKRLEKKYTDLDDIQNNIYLYLCQKNNATIKEIQNKFEIGRTFTKKTINILKSKNYIERVGNNRTGYWKCLK